MDRNNEGSLIYYLEIQMGEWQGSLDTDAGELATTAYNSNNTAFAAWYFVQIEL